MDTVYAVQIPLYSDPDGNIKPRFDLAPAEMFGRVQQLLAPGPVLLEPEAAIRTLNTKLVDFDDSDYLLCLGDPVAIAAAAMVASAMNMGIVNLLVYDRQTRSYAPVCVDIYKE